MVNFFWALTWGAVVTATEPENPLRSLPAAAVSVEGWLRERLERAAARLRQLRNPERLFADLQPEAAEKWHWGADYCGRWLEATCRLAECGLPDFDLEPILAELLRYQEPDGHFGRQRDHMTYWGDHRGLIALATLAAHGNQDALAAARKLADFYAARLATDDWAAMGALNGTPGTPGCPLEGLALLYRLTQEPRYLALAERIAARTMPTLAHPRGHSHTILTSCRGLADLAELTGKRKYLEVCEYVWELTAREHAYPSGSIPEHFPDTSGDETCSTADWLRLNFQLWRLTRNVRYLDAAERTIFNGLPFEQLPNGGFVGHRDLTGRVGEEWDFCCTHHGSLALVHVVENLYSVGPKEGENLLYVNFFLPSRAEMTFPDGTRVALVQEGDYPRGEMVALTMEAAAPVAFQFRVRVPPSARGVGLGEVKLNGAPLSPAADEGAFVLLRPPQGRWQPGDRLTWRCPVPLRVERRPPWETAEEQVAFWHGPLLLACGGVEKMPGEPPLLTAQVAFHPAEHLRREPTAENEFGLAYRLTGADGRRATLIPLASGGTGEVSVWMRVEKEE
ncbi:MAG TPA: hypothetical protein EYP85_01805 [Armatimonadetes bacterium]|nr:hypothetical protein [Armatimonadota bacterium]